MSPDETALLALLGGEPETERRYANLRPRPAAALIVTDTSGPSPRVLMGRRNPKLAFMGDKYVFPGGSVDPSDRRMASVTELDEGVVRALCARRTQSALGATLGAAQRAARAMALTAVRETFEETGYLVGASGECPTTPPQGSWSLFAGARVLPKLDDLRLIARAVTPPNRIRRFDTAFLYADASAIAGRGPVHIGENEELVDIAWMPIVDAPNYPLPSITRVILGELNFRLTNGLDAPARIPYYREVRGQWRREEL